jgi:hypothetical protein
MMVKKLFFVLSLILLLFLSQVDAQPQYPRVSQGASVSQMIGITNVTVTYHRPGVKGRLIWGEVVPFGELWRAGANEATTIEFSTDVLIEGTKIPAGKYSFFILLKENSKSAMLILNKNVNLWGTSDYNKEEDILRLEVKPEYLEHEEWLIYTFENIKKDFSALRMHWEDFAVSLPITVETDKLVLEGARKAKGWKEKMNAAKYCLENDVALEEGSKWIDESVSEERNYWNLSLQAQYQAEKGKKDTAIKTMQEALSLGEKMERKPYNLDDMKESLKNWEAK